MSSAPILATLRNAAHTGEYVPSALVLDALAELDTLLRDASRQCVTLHGPRSPIPLALRALARTAQPFPRRDGEAMPRTCWDT